MLKKILQEFLAKIFLTSFIITMLNRIQSQNTFTGCPKPKKVLPRLKTAFESTLPDLRSPSKLMFLSPEELASREKEFKDLNERLHFVRDFIKTLYQDGDLVEHFRGFIGCIKVFNVANCDEFAEITKIILRINGIKKCDMYSLYAKKINSKEPPRMLDHAVTAIKVPKRKNNKQTQKPFIPNKHTIIADMWLNGFIGKISDAKTLYKKIGLKDDEIIMLKPLPTIEPDKKCFEKIKQEFPTLKIKA